MIDGITYQSLKNTVVSWIKANCYNLGDRYNSISNCVKDGTRYVVGTNTYGSYSETVYYTIQSPLTQAVSASVVDEDMNSFYAKIGSPTGDIAEDKFYDYINDLVSFCCTKLCFITSQYGIEKESTVKYLVYLPQNSSFKKQVYISPSTAKTYTVAATDVNNLWQTIIEMMIRNNGYIRVAKTSCTFSFSKNH